MSIDAVTIPGRIKLREIPDVHARNSESGNRALKVRRWCESTCCNPRYCIVGAVPIRGVTG